MAEKKDGRYYLRKKLELSEATNQTLANEVVEKNEIIRSQCDRIQTLSRELSEAHGDVEDYRRRYEDAVQHMGWFRRWLYGHNVPLVTSQDHWNN